MINFPSPVDGDDDDDDVLDLPQQKTGSGLKEQSFIDSP